MNIKAFLFFPLLFHFPVVCGLFKWESFAIFLRWKRKLQSLLSQPPRLLGRLILSVLEEARHNIETGDSQTAVIN